MTRALLGSLGSLQPLPSAMICRTMASITVGANSKVTSTHNRHHSIVNTIGGLSLRLRQYSVNDSASPFLRYRNPSSLQGLSSATSRLATAPSTTSTFAMRRSLSKSASSGQEMKDEYGALDSAGHTFAVDNFCLESGHVLPLAELRYQTYGQLNAKRDNVIVVCHALTGNASLHAWWGGLLTSALQHDVLNGPNPNDNGASSLSSSSASPSPYFVVCCNILGSCYGSTGPASINPTTGRPYGRDFPDVSIRDTVRLQLQLLQTELQVSSVLSVIGGSFGGMQAVEFAVQAGCSGNSSGKSGNTDTGHWDDHQPVYDAHGHPYVRTVIPIACGAQHTAWQIGISEVQRQAIYMDPAWHSNPFAATSGLQVARQLGMLSYRTAAAYQTKFGRTTAASPSTSPPYGSSTDWQVKRYLEYQGRKFLSRLDPVTYVKLTEQMDSHDVTRRRGDSISDVLSRVTIPALVLGIDSDILYPITEQQALAAALPQSTFHTIHSTDGHDGFLLEQDQVASHISTFLAQHAN